MLDQMQYGIAHLIAAAALLAGFALLYQRRLHGMVNVYAMQAAAVGAAALWASISYHKPELIITAAVTLGLKTAAIPIGLYWLIRRLGSQATLETALGIGFTMLAGVGLVALATLLVRPVEPVAGGLVREHIAVALSMVLLGLLVMVSRRNAISQVIGFMALENGVSLAAIGVRGMPLVVEIGVAFLVLIAFTLFGLFFFRIRERFESLDLSLLERFRGEGE